MENDKILEIKNLFVKFPMDGGAINAVNGVNLSLGKGETLGSGRRVRLRKERYDVNDSTACKDAACKD